MSVAITKEPLTDLTNGFTTVPSSPHYTAKRVICTSSTMESTIWQLRDDPLFDVTWRTTLRPEGPFVPWYPGTGKIPHGYGWLDPVFAQNTHFNPPVTDYQYDTSRAFWAFSDLQNLIDPIYGQDIALNKHNDMEQLIKLEITLRDALEHNWAAKQRVIEMLAMLMNKFDHKMASNFLAEYTNQSAGEAWGWAKDFYRTLATVKIQIMAAQISKSDAGTVSVAILSNGKFDATLVDPASISMGVGYKNARPGPNPPA